MNTNLNLKITKIQFLSQPALPKSILSLHFPLFQFISYHKKIVLSQDI